MNTNSAAMTHYSVAYRMTRDTAAGRVVDNVTTVLAADSQTEAVQAVEYRAGKRWRGLTSVTALTRVPTGRGFAGR